MPRTATRVIRGMISFRSSSCLPVRSGVIKVVPVTFPPGRARLATSPVPTASPTPDMTTGIVVVAFLTACAASVLAVTITSGFMPTNSAASPASRSVLPSAHRYSTTIFCPSVYPNSRSPCRNASERKSGPDEGNERNATRGTFFGCCALTSAPLSANATARATILIQLGFWILRPCSEPALSLSKGLVLEFRPWGRLSELNSEHRCQKVMFMSFSKIPTPQLLRVLL